MVRIMVIFVNFVYLAIVTILNFTMMVYEIIFSRIVSIYRKISMTYIYVVIQPDTIFVITLDIVKILDLVFSKNYSKRVTDDLVLILRYCKRTDISNDSIFSLVRCGEKIVEMLVSTVNYIVIDLYIFVCTVKVHIGIMVFILGENTGHIIAISKDNDGFVNQEQMVLSLCSHGNFAYIVIYCVMVYKVICILKGGFKTISPTNLWRF